MTLRSKRLTLRTALVCGVLAALFGGAPATAGDLADLIPNLFDTEIFLKPPSGNAPSHSAHFSDQEDKLRATGGVINQALVSQLSTFPIASTSGGFTYSYDASVGSFTRVSDSFGPLFTERAQTIGKGKWNVGFSYLSASYDSIDDLDLDNGELAFHLQHQDTNRDGTTTSLFFEGDVIQADTIIDLESDTATAFFTYGVSNRFDIAIAAPIVSVDLEARARLTIVPLGTMVPGSIHAFNDDECIPGATPPCTQREFSDSGSSSGIGDLLVRGKYRLSGTHGRGFALAADIRLPTGSEENLRGTGGTQTKLFVIGSTAWGSFSPHVNLGYTFSSGGGDVVGEVPDEINYSLGLDWAVSPRVTLNAEFVGRTLRDTIRLEEDPKTFMFCRQQAPGSANCADATGVQVLPELQASRGDLDLWLGAAGLRFNPVGNFLVSANVLFSLSDEGLQDEDVIPVVSLDYSF
jgi:hypothetical protein